MGTCFKRLLGRSLLLSFSFFSPLGSSLGIGEMHITGTYFYGALQLEETEKHSVVGNFALMVQNDTDALQAELAEKNHRKDGPLFKIETIHESHYVWKISSLVFVWRITYSSGMSFEEICPWQDHPHLPDEWKILPEFLECSRFVPGFFFWSSFRRRNSSEYLLFGELGPFWLDVKLFSKQFSSFWKGRSRLTKKASHQ